MSRSHHRLDRGLVALSVLAVIASIVAAGVAGVAEAAERARISGGDFQPGGDPSTTYGTGGPFRCSDTSGVLGLVVDSLAEAARRAGRSPPVADGRACAIANAFLSWDPAAQGTPRPEVLSFVSYWHGLPVPVQEPTVAVIETDDYRLVAESVAGSAAGSAALNAVYGRIGVATQPIRRGRNKYTRVSIVVVDAAVELQPFPRALALGQKARLSGKLLASLTSPRVLVSDAVGRLSIHEQFSDTSFEAEVACGDRPGRILVEIRGEFEGREGIVASFPVACGTEFPRSVALVGEPWPEEAGAAERKILEKVNAERAAAGLEPIVWDDAVARVARDISGELSRSGGASAGVDLRQRLEAEGIAPPLMLQSAVADRSVARAHERLLTSPTNRANLLNPEPNRAGVGVVRAQDASGAPIYYVTEILIREPPPVDQAKARDGLRQAVARKRSDARAPAIEPDADLDRIGQAYAEALATAGGSLPKDKVAALKTEIERSFRGATVVAGARQETLDLAEEPQVTSAGKLLGVGIAQGRHPTLGRSAVYAVIVIASPKTGPEKPLKKGK